MPKSLCLGIALMAVFTLGPLRATAEETTRIADDQYHVCQFSGGYPYREKSDFVMNELDLRAGDVVVDIGAGDGWWSKLMAKQVGAKGVIHASEVAEKKVDKMKKELAELTNIRPYLSPLDGTGLPDDSCDLAFISKVYHHLPDGGRVDYLRNLKGPVTPTGRLCIIERHSLLVGSKKGRAHGWPMGRLIEQAEEAGWIAVRCEMLRGTHHYIAIFAQKELFRPKE